MEFLTMICDIKGSKLLKNREKVQYDIIDMLSEGNKLFHNYIAAPFEITTGDEWEGLLFMDCNYKEIITFFHEKLGETTFYCGVGRGTISINNFSLPVNQLDGQSFHFAREALNIAKGLKLPFIYIETDISIKF